ncbi:MAG: hypothetical protein Q7S69_04495 [Nitrosomonadaceae bacterium]|nr:hypothetical protein [Nitrosomonadaceae bacterium]
MSDESQFIAILLPTTSNALYARHSLKPFSELAITGVLAHKTIFEMG